MLVQAQFTHVVASLITKFKTQTFISNLKLHTALYSFVLESIHIEVYSKNLLWMCFSGCRQKT